jgi:hypothetical protein
MQISKHSQSFSRTVLYSKIQKFIFVRFSVAHIFKWTNQQFVGTNKQLTITTKPNIIQLSLKCLNKRYQLQIPKYPARYYLFHKNYHMALDNRMIIIHIKPHSALMITETRQV